MRIRKLGALALALGIAGAMLPGVFAASAEAEPTIDASSFVATYCTGATVDITQTTAVVGGSASFAHSCKINLSRGVVLSVSGATLTGGAGTEFGVNGGGGSTVALTLSDISAPDGVVLDAGQLPSGVSEPGASELVSGSTLTSTGSVIINGSFAADRGTAVVTGSSLSGSVVLITASCITSFACVSLGTTASLGKVVLTNSSVTTTTASIVLVSTNVAGTTAATLNTFHVPTGTDIFIHTGIGGLCTAALNSGPPSANTCS